MWQNISEGKFLELRQKMKFSIKDFFSECDQIRRKLTIFSQFLTTSPNIWS